MTVAAETTLYWRIKEAVKASLVTLHEESDPGGLGIGDRVYSDIIPDENRATVPCVFLTVADEAEEEFGGTTHDVYTWCPVRVFLADREGKKRSENEPKYLAWRKQIADHFRGKSITLTVPEVAWCEIRYQKVFDPQLPMYQYLVSGLALRFFVATARDNP